MSTTRSQRMDDIDLLTRALGGIARWKAKLDDEESRTDPTKHDGAASAFADMLKMLERRPDRALSPKQRAWVRGVSEEVNDSPEYANAWSAGEVPRGDILKTKIPEVLQRPLPLKPPGHGLKKEGRD